MSVRLVVVRRSVDNVYLHWCQERSARGINCVKYFQNKEMWIYHKEISYVYGTKNKTQCSCLYTALEFVTPSLPTTRHLVTYDASLYVSLYITSCLHDTTV